MIAGIIIYYVYSKIIIKITISMAP